MYDTTNIFQKILNKEVDAAVVYESDSVLAFLDINPIEKGHTLVIPKVEVEHILDLEDGLVGAFWKEVHYVSKGVMRALQADGCNISTNIGACAGQEVFHAHVHIIPRFATKARGFERGTYAEGEMEPLATLLAKTL